MQNCTCLDAHSLVVTNTSVMCVADLTTDHRKISIVLLVVIPAVVIFFILLDALGRLRRGSLERYVKLWVKHKGAPGKLNLPC